MSASEQGQELDVDRTRIAVHPSPLPPGPGAAICGFDRVELPTPDLNELESERFDLSKDSVECGLVREPVGELRLAAILPPIDMIQGHTAQAAEIRQASAHRG